MNITSFEAKELYSLGFSFCHYQKNSHKGMVYLYGGSEWVIGGNVDDDISVFDKEIIKKGLWLPSEMHLIEWLLDNEFVFSIVNVDGFFDFTCKDSMTNTKYHTKVPTLELALVTVIKKILKKGERTFDNNEKKFGVIKTNRDAKPSVDSESNVNEKTD